MKYVTDSSVMVKWVLAEQDWARPCDSAADDARRHSMADIIAPNWPTQTPPPHGTLGVAQRPHNFEVATLPKRPSAKAAAGLRGSRRTLGQSCRTAPTGARERKADGPPHRVGL